MSGRCRASLDASVGCGVGGGGDGAGVAWRSAVPFVSVGGSLALRALRASPRARAKRHR